MALIVVTVVAVFVHLGGRSLDARPFVPHGVSVSNVGGTIAVGADADLAIVDLDLEQVVTPELCQSAQDHTPFEGIAVKGWPTRTVLRGRTVFDDGQVTDAFPRAYVKR